MGNLKYMINEGDMRGKRVWMEKRMEKKTETITSIA